MADIINFNDFDEEADITSMSIQDLKQYLASIQAQISELDEHEPRNMNSAKHEEWGYLHEDLEDMADEIIDRLEELQR